MDLMLKSLDISVIMYYVHVRRSLADGEKLWRGEKDKEEDEDSDKVRKGGRTQQKVTDAGR